MASASMTATRSTRPLIPRKWLRGLPRFLIALVLAVLWAIPCCG